MASAHDVAAYILKKQGPMTAMNSKTWSTTARRGHWCGTSGPV